MQGHYGKFTYFCDIPDDGVTSYKKQFPFKDKHPIDNWKNNYHKISFFSNNVSPEPKTLGKYPRYYICIARTARNIMMFNKQLKDMAGRTINTTTISPQRLDETQNSFFSHRDFVNSTVYRS